MLVASLSLQSNAMVNAGALKLNGIDGIPQAYQRLVEQPRVNCYSGPSPVKCKSAITEFMSRL